MMESATPDPADHKAAQAVERPSSVVQPESGYCDQLCSHEQRRHLARLFATNVASAHLFPSKGCNYQVLQHVSKEASCNLL